MKKKGDSNSLRYQAYGKYSQKTKAYHATFDFSRAMEHLNGDYEIKLHVSDYRAIRSEVWDLGTIKVWFKEGLDDGDNLGVKSEYKPDSVIEYYFAPQ